ncbi:hypothetical protein MLD38_033556 [Melastoma candidum]|uniref:Uncharacterized protein n=1 Tax=Melastoma candidum TaxID=119954 RepID=A0ACB9M750_9MYRT|nr:hypothetical protein MLD38_033556 [Melastoma candidum]
MGVERFGRGHYTGMETTHVMISILLVDDDSTVLAIASMLLRTFKYEVKAVKSPADALSSLRGRRGAYDLVVTDYHMPGMNGLELQKVVQAEYKLPVIVMSADERECIIMKTLECGAAFFIAKPIKAEDVKNIWQYAVASRKGKSVPSLYKAGVINVGHGPTAREVEAKRIAGLGGPMDMECGGETTDAEEVDSLASMAEIKERRSKRGASKRKHQKKEKGINGGQSSQPNNPKRSKVVWTTTLHNLFLQALNHIGLDKAVPKNILEYMGVPGITRENVASHLQKYRIFLRRVADKTYARSTSLEKTSKLSFVTTHQSMINNFQEDGLGYFKPSRLNLPDDFCKNLSSSSSGILIESSSRSNSVCQFSSQSLDKTDTGIGFEANSSGLRLISHQVDSMETTIPSVVRLPFGNAITTTTNSLASTNHLYMKQFQSRELPLVPLGGVGTTVSVNQKMEKQNLRPALTARNSINPIDDDDIMNSAERFMDILTQEGPSVRLNGPDYPTPGFPSLLINNSAATTPALNSALNEENKEDHQTPGEKKTALPNTCSQHQVGDNDLFNVLFEHMHYSDHRRRDSSGNSMDIFSSCYDLPFGGAPRLNQEHGNEHRRFPNPMEPCLLQSQATQDQQPAALGPPTVTLPRLQDVWIDNPSAEDQVWAEDFLDSLLDTSSPPRLL